MTARTRTLRANAGLVLAGDIASKLGLFVATLVAARALSIGEFAAVAAALAVAGIMASILDSGSALLITRDGIASAGVRVSLAIALARARVPLACLIEHTLDLRGLRIGIVLSGGNVDLDRLPWQR